MRCRIWVNSICDIPRATSRGHDAQVLNATRQRDERINAVSEAIRRHPRFIALLRDMNLDYWADKLSQPKE